MPHKEHYIQAYEDAQYEFLNNMIAGLPAEMLFPMIAEHGLEPLMDKPILKVQEMREKYSANKKEEGFLPF